jgi:hypothetical protein
MVTKSKSRTLTFLAVAALAAGAVSFGQAPAGPAEGRGGAIAGRGGGGGGGGGFGTGSIEGDPTPGFGRPMIDLYAAGVAGSRARGSTTLFNDVETTQMTRFEEKMAAELAVVRGAREALIAAAFAPNPDSTLIVARARALAAAELALAMKRADEFPELRDALNLSAPERMANFLPQMR